MRENINFVPVESKSLRTFTKVIERVSFDV